MSTAEIAKQMTNTKMVALSRCCEINSSIGSLLGSSVPGIVVPIEFAERHLEHTKQCCRGKASMTNDLREACLGTEYGDALAKWTCRSEEQVVTPKPLPPIDRQAANEKWAADNKKRAEAAYERSRKNPLDAYMYDFMQWQNSAEQQEYEAAEAALLKAKKRLDSNQAAQKMPQIQHKKVVANDVCKAQNSSTIESKKEQFNDESNESSTEPISDILSKLVSEETIIHLKNPAVSSLAVNDVHERKNVYIGRQVMPIKNLSSNSNSFDAVELVFKSQDQRIVGGFQWGLMS
jgi:hypothetical protein